MQGWNLTSRYAQNDSSKSLAALLGIYSDPLKVKAAFYACVIFMRICIYKGLRQKWEALKHICAPFTPSVLSYF